MTKRTLVLGGSVKPERYSNKAIRRLLSYGHPVVAIGVRAGMVGDVAIETGRPEFSAIHTVTLYLNPLNQEPYYDYIIGLNPKRVIFNPGTENMTFSKLINEAGIETVEHCTLVMLDAGIF